MEIMADDLKKIFTALDKLREDILISTRKIVITHPIKSESLNELFQALGQSTS